MPIHDMSDPDPIEGRQTIGVGAQDGFGAFLDKSSNDGHGGLRTNGSMERDFMVLTDDCGTGIDSHLSVGSDNGVDGVEGSSVQNGVVQRCGRAIHLTPGCITGMRISRLVFDAMPWLWKSSGYRCYPRAGGHHESDHLEDAFFDTGISLVICYSRDEK